MSEPLKGEQVIIKFDAGSGLFLPFACARSITLNMLSDIIGKSTVGSGNWKEKEVVVKDWNFSIEGIVYLAEPDSTDAETIIDIWLSMQPIAIEFFMDDGVTTVQMNGNALITNVSANGAVNNVSSFNITGEGTGELQKT